VRCHIDLNAVQLDRSEVARTCTNDENNQVSCLKEGSRVRQKHNCLVILFIAAIATTCFGRAWPSSGHKVDVYK
jgi:hypothetical protein